MIQTFIHRLLPPLLNLFSVLFTLSYCSPICPVVRLCKRACRAMQAQERRCFNCTELTLLAKRSEFMLSCRYGQAQGARARRVLRRLGERDTSRAGLVA